MKIAEVFKKKTDPKPTDLEDTLGSIIKIEERRDSAKDEIENARRHLENEHARAIDGADDTDLWAAAAEVVGEQENLNSLENLLKRAKDKAIAVIAGTHADRQKRLSEIEKEIAETRAAIDTRKIATIARFAKKHGLKVDWPTKNGAGAIHLPATSVDGDELLKVAGAVVVAVDRDEEAGRLDELEKERIRLNMMIRTPPDSALESLLAEKRRK